MGGADRHRIMAMKLSCAAALATVCSFVSASAFAQSSPPGEVVAVGCSSVVVAPNAPSAASAPAPCPSPHATEIESAKRRVWYGWQTLTADGVALILASTAGSSDSSPASLGVASLAVYALGGPVIHAANGSVGKMGLSLAMRVGAPLLLGAGSYYAAGGGSGGDWGPALIAIGGAVVGTAGAIAVDAAVLARKDAPSEPKAASLRIMPSVAPARGGGATVGAIGTF